MRHQWARGLSQASATQLLFFSPNVSSSHLPAASFLRPCTSHALNRRRYHSRLPSVPLFPGDRQIPGIRSVGGGGEKLWQVEYRQSGKNMKIFQTSCEGSFSGQFRKKGSIEAALPEEGSLSRSTIRQISYSFMARGKHRSDSSLKATPLWQKGSIKATPLWQKGKCRSDSFVAKRKACFFFLLLNSCLTSMCNRTNLPTLLLYFSNNA